MVVFILFCVIMKKINKMKYIYIYIYIYIHTGTSKKKNEYHEKGQYFFVPHFRKKNPYIIYIHYT